jgi:hypothetical protein
VLLERSEIASSMQPVASRAKKLEYHQDTNFSFLQQAAASSSKDGR